LKNLGQKMYVKLKKQKHYFRDLESQHNMQMTKKWTKKCQDINYFSKHFFQK
jgi:hypothetical protein